MPKPGATLVGVNVVILVSSSTVVPNNAGKLQYTVTKWRDSTVALRPMENLTGWTNFEPALTPTQIQHSVCFGGKGTVSTCSVWKVSWDRIAFVVIWHCKNKTNLLCVIGGKYIYIYIYTCRQKKIFFKSPHPVFPCGIATWQPLAACLLSNAKNNHKNSNLTQNPQSQCYETPVL